MDRDLGLLICRIAMSVVFLFSGIDKLFNWPLAIEEAATLGLPQFSVVLAIMVQLAGSLAVIVGLFFRVSVSALLLFTLAATLIAHWPIGLGGSEWRMALTVSLEHLAIIGGFLLLLITGPGKFTFWKAV